MQGVPSCAGGPALQALVVQLRAPPAVSHTPCGHVAPNAWQKSARVKEKQGGENLGRDAWVGLPRTRPVGACVAGGGGLDPQCAPVPRGQLVRFDSIWAKDKVRFPDTGRSSFAP